MKITDIILSATSNMFRSKVRTILTIVAIFIGAFTIALTVGVNIGVNDYIDKQLGVYGEGDILEVQANSISDVFGASEPEKYDPDKAGTSSSSSAFKQLTEKDIKTIRSIDGIEKVDPYRLVSTDYISGKNNEKYNVNVYGAYDGMIIDIANGDAVEVKANELQINLPIDYVKPLGYSSNSDAIGKTVKIATTNQVTQIQSESTFKIVGITNKNLLQGNFIFANEAAINKLHQVSTEGLPDSLKNQYVTSLARVNDSVDNERLQEIKKELTDKGYTALTVDDQIGIIRDVINAITAVLTAFGAIALFAASFGIINTLYMAVQERTREIGLMKALGLSSRKVFYLFSIEATMIGFWGSLFGVLVAVAVGSAVNNVASNTFLKSLTGFTLVQITLPAALAIMAIVMLIAFLAGTLPARRASKQNPIDALRYE